MRARNSLPAYRDQEHRAVVAVLLIRGVRDDVLLDLERIITESGENDNDENTIHHFTNISDNQQEGPRDSPAAWHPDAESRMEFLGWSMPYPKGVRIPDFPDSDRYWDYIQYAEAMDRLNRSLAPDKPCRSCVERLQRIYGIKPRLDWSRSSDKEESVIDESRFYIRSRTDGPVPLYYKRAGRTWHESCSSSEEDTLDMTGTRCMKSSECSCQKKSIHINGPKPYISANMLHRPPISFIIC